MKAIAQLKTAQILDRINALQTSTSHYFNSSQLTAPVREWREINEIDSLMKVDACAAWEAVGAWKGLAGDVTGTETAFANSIRLGNSGSNRENWMINRLNLGLFSAAQSLYAATGHPETGYFTLLLEDGYKAGAIEQAASFIERAREMRIKWDENQVHEVTKANAILRHAGISDQQIGRQLDVAGVVLRRHQIRPNGSVLVTSADDFFSGVTYSLAVPVGAEKAFDMNVELARAEDKAGISKNVAFDVVFEAVAS
ncbi:hypothetical protein AWB69_06884 [Caballeronia udeis]|uniref:Uncharacterized protein n=1 Tax=Caballeronia udeis TaxID=1232866 RepID=A0A158J0I4_9BURK|nr:hypothetical protein [Caballeronia udeis]SAL61869.1 hypothetical protein AWB69_06884 [Caballeronia udeis]